MNLQPSSKLITRSHSSMLTSITTNLVLLRLWYEYDPTMRWVRFPPRADRGGEVRFKDEMDAVFYKLRYG